MEAIGKLSAAPAYTPLGLRPLHQKACLICNLRRRDASVRLSLSLGLSRFSLSCVSGKPRVQGPCALLNLGSIAGGGHGIPGALRCAHMLQCARPHCEQCKQLKTREIRRYLTSPAEHQRANVGVDAL